MQSDATQANPPPSAHTSGHAHGSARGAVAEFALWFSPHIITNIDRILAQGPGSYEEEGRTRFLLIGLLPGYIGRTVDGTVYAVAVGGPSTNVASGCPASTM